MNKRLIFATDLVNRYDNGELTSDAMAIAVVYMGESIDVLEANARSLVKRVNRGEAARLRNLKRSQTETDNAES